MHCFLSGMMGRCRYLRLEQAATALRRPETTLMLFDMFKISNNT